MNILLVTLIVVVSVCAVTPEDKPANPSLPVDWLKERAAMVRTKGAMNGEASTHMPGFVYLPGVRMRDESIYFTKTANVHDCIEPCAQNKDCHVVTMMFGRDRSTLDYHCYHYTGIHNRTSQDDHWGTYVKADHSQAKWEAVCSGNVASVCTSTVTQSTSSSTTVSDKTSWEMQISASISHKLFFLHTSISADASWGQTIQSTYQSTRSRTVECGNEIHPDPKCISNSTMDLVVWQFRLHTPMVGIGPGTTTIATCQNWVTTSANYVPKCLPGLCKDCECQTCQYPRDDEARDLGLSYDASPNESPVSLEQ